MLNLTDVEKAYLAGLFDGEGSIGYYKRGYSHFAYFSICNTDFRLARWILDRTSIGTFTTRGAHGHLGKKPQWEWRIRSKGEIKLILTTIQPYLIIKADQVDLLLCHLDVEEKIGCKAGRKVPDYVRAQRIVVEEELKRLKKAVASNQNIQQLATLRS
jgi:hypothetical protein